MCAPWRSVDRRRLTLDEAVSLAESMRAKGWLPHEMPQPWDRTELATDERPIADAAGRDVALRIDALARRAAAPQGARLRPLPEGGVRIGAPHVPPQPSPAPHTRSTDATRAALYDDIVADVAAGALERGEVRVLGRLFMGPKGRPLYDAAWVNDHVADDAKTVALGSVRDTLAAGRYATKLDLYKSRLPVGGGPRG